MPNNPAIRARLASIDASAVIAKIRADLAYLLPNSGKPLGHIILTREEAERLIADIEGREVGVVGIDIDSGGELFDADEAS